MAASVYVGEVSRGYPLSITSKEMSYAGRTIQASEIVALRWGIFVRRVNGVETEHSFAIEVASAAQAICVEWGRRSILKSMRQFVGRQPLGAPIVELSSGDQQEHFSAIVQAVFGNYAAGVIQRMVAVLSSGGSFQFGAATATQSGVRFRVGWVFKKDVDYPWNQIVCGLGGGVVTISANARGAPHVACSLRDVRNAVMLPYLTKFMGGRMLP